MQQINAFSEKGFAIISDIYTRNEVEKLLELIRKADSDRATFRGSTDIFAIRQFLKEVPETVGVIQNEKLKAVLTKLLGDNYFIVKSIYFDKPPASNW